GLYPPTASTSAGDAAATPNSCPRAPAGALLVVPHATVCGAAAAAAFPSPAPHTAVSTAATRPARLRFMPSPPHCQRRIGPHTYYSAPPGGRVAIRRRLRHRWEGGLPDAGSAQRQARSAPRLRS